MSEVYEKLPGGLEKANLNGFSGTKNGIYMSWHDVKYKVQAKYSKQEMRAHNHPNRYYEKQILYEQNGYVQPGEALFIMGPSGAGKSSLLNALCDRATCEGQVLYNGKTPITQDSFGQFGAYVTQDDVLFATLTCQECLQFAAKLKLGLNDEDTHKKVEEIIFKLGLNKCRNTLVGNNLIRGLSGGERKRTAIGVELITNPSVLMLDEPTSGLDSFNATKIVKILSRQARAGKTIIATIHQPNSTIFALFDRLILLQEGRCVYQGKAQDCVSYFNTINLKCPENYNPADFFLKELSGPNDAIQKVQDEYEKNILDDVGKITEQRKIMHKDSKPRDVRQHTNQAGWFTQCRVLMKRTLMDTLRNPLYLRARFVQTLFIALLTLSTFFKLGFSVEDVRSKSGLIFFICNNQTILSFMGTLLSFTKENPVLKKEYKSNTYGIVAYYTAKTIIELPFLVILPIIFSSIVYFGVGLDTNFDNFAAFVGGVILLVLSASSLGLAVGSIFINDTLAVALGPAFIAPMIIFGGFLTNLDKTYDWVSWLQYVSPIRYASEILLRNEFDGNDKYQFNPTTTVFGFDFGSKTCLIMLISITVGLRLISLIALKLSVRK